MHMKRFVYILAGLCLAACASNPGYTVVDRMTHDPNATNTETILHVWSWNFPTIAENMKQIADAGYTMIQTSPVNACFSPEGANIKILDEKEGNWYHYYQPTDWTIGNNIVGTEEEMKVMLDSAKKYDIRVLVDVLPNHTAFNIDLVSDEFYAAVGGREKMFHTNGLKGIRDYNDRAQCTHQGVGGLPDVNTENPLFQKYYMQFVNKLVEMGVRGFRYVSQYHILSIGNNWRLILTYQHLPLNHSHTGDLIRMLLTTKLISYIFGLNTKTIFHAGYLKTIIYLNVVKSVI